MTKLYGSLEAGGTKFVCAVGDENYNVVEKVQFPTTKPIETIDKCIEFFSKFEDLVGLAIGSFGPIDIDPNSNTYGFITTTPKPNWANVDIVGAFRRALNVPIYFTTDVNSSAYGEVVARNNAGGHIENLVYYTIGTGIGAGVIQRGEFIGGAGHPEMGHYYVAQHPMDVEKEFKTWFFCNIDIKSRGDFHRFTLGRVHKVDPATGFQRLYFFKFSRCR